MLRLSIQVATFTAFVGVCALLACGDDPASGFPDGRRTDAGPTSSSGFPITEGGAGDDDDSANVGVLEAVVRDFKQYDEDDETTNPDFENVPPEEDRPDDPPDGGPPYVGPWTEATAKYYPEANYALDIVQDTLGADNLPVYNETASWNDEDGRTATTHGKQAFDQWYRDTAGVNVVRKVRLQLTRDPSGVYSYDSAVSGLPESAETATKGFWPIDDASPLATTAEGFGNQGRPHNYHFTVELHTKFKYRGTETFKFSGDDDVFVFINKKLVINIGGIHGALSKEVSLPSVAGEIGLVVGEEYPLDFFQAERHITQSNLRIDTTLELKPQGVN
jgi:fibro-slime domain-containing protein